MKPSKIVSGIYISGSIILGACLNFLANLEWRFWFEKVALLGKFTLASILLPLVLLIDYAKVGIAAWAIYQERKATPFNVSHLIVEIIKAALATPAILGVIGYIALPSLVGPSLFITAISVGAVYNLVLASYHAWQWTHAENESAAHRHKLLTLKYGSAATVGVLLAVGVGVVLLGSLGAVALFVVGALTASVLIYGGVAAGVISYQVDKTLAEEAPVVTQAEVLRPLLTLSPDANPSINSGPSRLQEPEFVLPRRAAGEEYVEERVETPRAEHGEHIELSEAPRPY